jgi:hypothetical protein
MGSWILLDKGIEAETITLGEESKQKLDFIQAPWSPPMADVPNDS